MNDKQKSFQQKVKNRRFVIENSRKALMDCEDGMDRLAQNPEDQIWELLGENLHEADLYKLNNGQSPLFVGPGILGRLVFFIKRAIRKLLNVFLGWYVEPIFQRQNQFNGKIINAASLEREIIYKLGKRIDELENANIQLKKTLSERIEKEDAALEKNRIDICYATTTATNVANKLVSDMENIDASFRAVDGYLEQLDEKLTREVDDRNTKFEQLDEKLFRESAKRQELLGQQAASIKDLETKLVKIENLPTSDDDFYHHFEERFRGSREDIKKRLQVYVPVIKEHLQDWSQARFVDIGSGRGEWLDILSENGATEYVGVDLNERQNAIAESYGHQTVCQDCIDYLAGLEDESIDLISGIQIIEHMCMSDLMELLKQSHRVLKKGGMILFETQNPRNIVVGAGLFYADPSHKRVLDPQMVAFLAEWLEFDSVRIIDANANPLWESLPLPEAENDNYKLIKQFNDVKWLLYGPMDYALFAVKE